ncbi:MAG: PAS domain S-box protein [Planctomycetes bacterium]|nr:PAS domain S-box protein [Planctomycetota bacterium]
MPLPAPPFASSGFVPRWQCGDWPAWLGWTHILSDVAIWLAYLAIPLVLVYFVRRRRDAPFSGLFWLFGAFIVTCGTTHLLEAVIFFDPVYELSGAVKLATAVASWATVIALAPVLPKALAMRTPQQLEAEVTARTDELAAANAELQREVARRKQAEDEARASEDRFRKLADAIPQIAWVSGPDGGTTYLNRRWTEYTGLEGDGAEQSARVIHPDDLPAVSAARDRARAAGEQYQVEFRMRPAAGGWYRWFLARSVPVRDPDGIVREWFGTSTDIDDVKRAEVETERALARLRAVVDTMADGVVIADPSGNLIDWNPAALRMHGFASAEEVRRPLSSFTSMFVLSRPGGAPLPLDEWPLSRVLRGEVLRDYELRVRRTDTGQDHIISYAGALVPGTDGQHEQAVLTLHEVTDQRRLEAQYRQAQKMEAVGQLAGGIAHDFNNLLTVINGYSELILGEVPADDPARDGLVAIRDAGRRAAALTAQLLAFSRKAVVEPKILDPNQVAESSVRLLGRLLGENIRIDTELNSSARVKIDPGQLEQVLLNLAVNARDAMPDGGTLTVATADVFLADGAPTDSGQIVPGRYVELKVTDTGVGMTDQVRAKIFEPFFTTKELGKGTGLGLATVYGILRQAGGAIFVESEVGRGTAFRVLLPVGDAVAEARSALIRVAPRGSETVLLAEDEQEVRRLARLALEQHGYTVIEAGSGAAAFRAAAAYPGAIHLLVTDVVMPDGGGRELAERLKAVRPDVRVLFMSGYTGDPAVRQAAGSDAFLQKPFTPLVLARKVREVLDRDRGG